MVWCQENVAVGGVVGALQCTEGGTVAACGLCAWRLSFPAYQTQSWKCKTFSWASFEQHPLDGVELMTVALTKLADMPRRGTLGDPKGVSLGMACEL